MKLIHTADLHLDAECSANYPPEMAKKRRAALLTTFERMIRYAEETDVSGILIAGDLFDKKKISKTALSVVQTAVETHPGITFYYLRGNHDASGFPDPARPVPENLKMFGDSWRTYPAGEQGKVTVTGVELFSTNPEVYATLSLPPDKLNIVMLHGQEALSADKKNAEVIHLRALQNRNIDYLALGHIHSFKRAELDGRGIYVYPGCPEGRGFDECGEKGFVLLDIDEEERTLDSYFVSFAESTLYSVDADISEADTVAEITEAVEKAIGREKVPDGAELRVALVGEYDAEDEKDLSYLEMHFRSRFPVFRVRDHSVLRVDYERYASDRSLKGEFIRTVRDSDLSEEDKAAVIRTGIRALRGEKS